MRREPSRRDAEGRGFVPRLFSISGDRIHAAPGSQGISNAVRDTLIMALEDLVRYFARLRAQKSEYTSLHQMAERNDWSQEDVLAFVRCEREPSKKMLRDLARELGAIPEELQEILARGTSKKNPTDSA